MTQTYTVTDEDLVEIAVMIHRGRYYMSEEDILMAERRLREAEEELLGLMGMGNVTIRDIITSPPGEIGKE